MTMRGDCRTALREQVSGMKYSKRAVKKIDPIYFCQNFRVVSHRCNVN